LLLTTFTVNWIWNKGKNVDFGCLRFLISFTYLTFLVTYFFNSIHIKMTYFAQKIHKNPAPSDFWFCTCIKNSSKYFLVDLFLNWSIKNSWYNDNFKSLIMRVNTFMHKIAFKGVRIYFIKKSIISSFLFLVTITSTYGWIPLNNVSQHLLLAPHNFRQP